jgi:uncharacterized protein (TIGR02001 family)
MALMMSAAGVSHAQVSLNGSLGITSDYVQWGLSQTRGASAVQGGVRVDVDTRWSAGVWASQVDRNRGPGATYEFDAYLTRAWQLSPDWVATATATHYFFPNDTYFVRYDYDELALAVGYKSRVFATVLWSPNLSEVTRTQVAKNEDVWAYELTVSLPIVQSLSANAGIGRRDLSALFGESYWYGHAGLSLTAANMSLHLTYARTDGTARRMFGRERAANTLIGAVIWRFSSSH